MVEYQRHRSLPCARRQCMRNIIIIKGKILTRWASIKWQRDLSAASSTMMVNHFRESIKIDVFGKCSLNFIQSNKRWHRGKWCRCNISDWIIRKKSEIYGNDSKLKKYNCNIVIKQCLQSGEIDKSTSIDSCDAIISQVSDRAWAIRDKSCRVYVFRHLTQDNTYRKVREVSGDTAGPGPRLSNVEYAYFMTL